MNTETPSPNRIQFTSSALSRLVLACGILLSLLTSATRAANTFSPTGDLLTARQGHTATLLSNGKVLITGGSSSGIFSSCELYDAATGSWSFTGPLATSRTGHTATLLPNGEVLVVGGYNGGNVGSAEIYDPAIGQWSSAGSLATARRNHTATLLANGKVLVVGGYSGDWLDSAELYNPTTNDWSVVARLSAARYAHAATLLANGKVLVTGGVGVSSAELYDPTADSWSSAGTLSAARNGHSAITLPNGKVLIVGGGGNVSFFSNTEMYDPAAGTWSASGPLTTARTAHTASLLPSGKVLLVGGQIFTGTFLSSTELYDPSVGTWSATGTLSAARASHAATVLPNGTLLVTGGSNSIGQLSSTEIYNTATIPTVTTPTSASLTATTATLGGNVTSDGGASITSRGVVFAPTATNSNPQIGGTGVVNLTGTGTTGMFTVNAINLTPATAYTFAAYATNSVGTGYSSTDTFSTTAPSANANLSGLVLSAGTLSPSFTAATTSYTISVPNANSSISVTPTVAQENATIEVNNTTVASGTPSGAITLNVGSNTITTVVTAQDGITTKTYTVTVSRDATLSATYTTGAEVPVTSNGYTATGKTVSFAINYAPTTGTQLMVVKNSGLGFINGTFDNLPQGGLVTLPYNGVNYNFVANYYGGTGNDLVLVWQGTRAFSWGWNVYGQLGNGIATDGHVPAVVASTGALSGKTVVAMAAGRYHSLAVCSDGTVAAWGWNAQGQLGNNSTIDSLEPVAITGMGALFGKTVVAVAAGDSHSLALCSDGTVVAWGYNANGQVGNGTFIDKHVPVAVTTNTGALANKTAVAIASGDVNSFALCSDGTLAAWGDNFYGQIGNGILGLSYSVPLAVNTGVLSTRSVVAMAAGTFHSVALCSDGTVATWGSNSFGQLGNSSVVPYSLVPVAVFNTGVLASKTIVDVASGRDHCLALCSDGTMVSWGVNDHNQLGDGTSVNRGAPVAVSASVALSGKAVAAIAAGQFHSVALCSDGTLVDWGDNSNYQLGTNSLTNSPVPVIVSTSSLTVGERFTGLFKGSVNMHTFALVAALPPSAAAPSVNGPTFSSVTATTATLGGNVTSDGGATVTARGVVYAPTATNSNPQIGGTGVVNVTASGTTGIFTINANNLAPGTAYSFAAYATNSVGTGYSSTSTFPTTALSTNANLSDLALSAGTLSPSFTEATTSYTVSVPNANSSIFVTPTAAQANANIKVNNTTVTSGTPSGVFPLNVGNNTITTVVTAQDGNTTKTYTVTVSRAPINLNATYTTGNEVPLTTSSYTATGNTANFTLNYVPTPGTQLMVVKNTGLGFINGTFSGLPQGQPVELSYNGVIYSFVANYYGGTGNDLVLVWKGTRAYAWGNNLNGQLGSNSTAQLSNVPVAVTRTGVLAGRTVLAVAAGGDHSVALCSDGTVAGWGRNTYGQLGNNSTIDSNVPVAVAWPTTGALAGKTVVAVAAGLNHSLALCSDGTVAAWGGNNFGQLGNNSTTASSVPVPVSTAGVLSGKTVVAMGAGDYHSVVLCSDGSLAAWGLNNYAQLGDKNWYINSSVPVTVTNTGVLAGKTVVALAVGAHHSVVLCSDGSLAAWGSVRHGQLGDNSPYLEYQRDEPVAVDMTGVLASKTVVAVAAGFEHSLALCSDGTVVSWGYNLYGQLGNNNTVNSNVPVAVTSSVLLGKTVVAVAAGAYHSVALCSDGTEAAWGRNNNGQLGNNSTTDSTVPVAVTSTTLTLGARFTGLFAGSQSYHCLVLVAAASAPTVNTPTSASITATTATLGGNVTSDGGAAITLRGVVYAPTATNSNPQIGGLGVVNVTTSGTTGSFTVNATNLIPGTAYTFAAYAINSDDINYSSTGTFSTAPPNNNADLSGLVVCTGTLSPSFTAATTNYTVSVPNAVSSLSVTPTAVQADAAIKVNNTTVASGTPSGPIALNGGSNTITTVVTAQDGITTKTYTVTVSRDATLSATYTTGAEVPVTGSSYSATGCNVSFILNHAPTPGTQLMVVKNTGLGFINGTFSNLAQGETKSLSYNGVMYHFVANYYGGTGNDLVLVWKSTRAYGWGRNDYGQLGNNSNEQSNVPVAVTSSSVLAGKTVVSVTSSLFHSVALCSDGTVAAWGRNQYGQLGTSSTSDSSVPVAVTAGVLAGKTVVAVAAGAYHSVALCSDGTVAAWGANYYGQLGNNSTTDSSVPVAVNSAGVLSGKTVVAVASGYEHSLALCSDGTVVAWGYNYYGQLGNNSAIQSTVPVVVAWPTTGVLAAKTVVSLAAGIEHSLALCSDGTVAAWGRNQYGQLGNSTTSDSSVPVAVTSTGVLLGRAVVAVAAGASHNVAVCSDGAMVAWGNNSDGQLGNNSTDYQSNVPVAVTSAGVLAGKTVLAVAAGAYHSAALCSDGSVAAWGWNHTGQLGNSSTSSSTVPVAVKSSTLAPGERFTGLFTGFVSYHCLALVAAPPADVVIESFRQTWYGISGNTGNAADNADPYHTGIPNLDVFAFFGPNQNPALAKISQLPQMQNSGGNLFFSFTQPAGVSGIIYGAEKSPTMANGSWLPVTDTGSGTQHTFSVPINGNPQMFLRLTVVDP